MPTTRPFTYNTGSVIDGTEQIGTLAIGTASLDYSSNPGNARWWIGPNEDNRYVIAKDVPASNWPTQLPEGNVGNVNFWASSQATAPSFISVANRVTNQKFNNGSQAKSYLDTNGYWTNYVTSSEITPSISASALPTKAWWWVHTPYNNTVYGDNIYTNEGAEFGIYKWDGNDVTVSSSVANLENYTFRAFDLSSDNKKIAIALSWFPGVSGDSFSRVGMIDVPTDTIITSSLAIPGTSSSSGAPYQWVHNGVTYDSLRNEFIVSAYGYQTYSGSNNIDWAYGRLLRFNTSSFGLEGYYTYIDSGSYAINTSPYGLPFKYNPNDDCLYSAATTVSGSPSIIYNSIYKHNISTGQNSIIYQKTSSYTYDSYGRSSEQWNGFYYSLIPETNDIWVSETYYSQSDSKVYFSIRAFDLDTNTMSDQLYVTRSLGNDWESAQNTWAYNPNTKILYTVQNAAQAWDVETRSLLTEITSSLSPNGGTNSPLSSNNKILSNSTNNELWITFTSPGYINVFDMSGL